MAELNKWKGWLRGSPEVGICRRQLSAFLMGGKRESRWSQEGPLPSDTVEAQLLGWELSCDMSIMQNICFTSPQSKLFWQTVCSALSNYKHVLIKKCYKYIYVNYIFEHLVFENYFLKKERKKCLNLKNNR